jgi:hypothetical protein
MLSLSISPNVITLSGFCCFYLMKLIMMNKGDVEPVQTFPKVDVIWISRMFAGAKVVADKMKLNKMLITMMYAKLFH